MSLGVGLGAFMDGFERGSNARDKIDNRNLQKKNRAALDKIEADTQAQFDAEVASGNQDGKNYDQFWKQYALPKRKTELLKQGDVAGARSLEEWGNSDAALQGGRLFSSAMLKAQTGDAGGALADVIKAGQVKGYIEHGYELAGQDEIVDKDGNQIGYRLRVRDQDGKELQQDIATADIPRMVSTFANPDAAWQSQLEKRAAEDKKSSELDTYKKKKEIDRDFPTAVDDAENYRKAREARMKSDLDFADLGPDEQDAAIRKDLEAADGYAAQRRGSGAASSAPAPKRVLVDRQSGQAVSPAAASPAAARRIPPEPDPNVVGLGTAPTPVPSQAPGLSGTAPAPVPTPRPQTRQAPSREDYIADAADNMMSGGNPEIIGQRLLQAGIPPEQWPQDLQQAFQKRQIPGLGQ